MIVAISDTHCRSEPELHPHLRSDLEAATLVVHAGDFTTEVAYDYFRDLATELVAVTGNRDRKPLRQTLPEQTTVDHSGLGLAVVHGHGHDRTSLSLLARQEGADVVVRGHSHRPGIERVGEQLLVNPGSHADPRGNRPGYATFERNGAGVLVSLQTPAGDPIESSRLRQ